MNHIKNRHKLTEEKKGMSHQFAESPFIKDIKKGDTFISMSEMLSDNNINKKVSPWYFKIKP